MDRLIAGDCTCAVRDAKVGVRGRVTDVARLFSAERRGIVRRAEIRCTDKQWLFIDRRLEITTLFMSAKSLLRG